MKSRREEDHKAYCRARNKVTRTIRGERKKFEQSTAMNIKQNPKTAWKYMKAQYKIKEGIQPLKINPDDPTRDLQLQTRKRLRHSRSSFVASSQ